MPKIIPKIVPIAAITIAVVAFGSLRDFAIAASTRPIGPKTIGKIQIEIAPKMIATVEYELPGALASIFDEIGAEDSFFAPHDWQNCPSEFTAVPQFLQNIKPSKVVALRKEGTREKRVAYALNNQS